jgi:3-oxoadipate enol-lactonase
MDSGTHWLEVEPGIRLKVVVDDFTDRWVASETVLLVHGMGQNLEAWRGWVPHLARDYRVVRFDVRGFGESTPIAPDAPWSIERLLQDIEAVMDFVGCTSAHVMGAQSGATQVLALGARHRARVRSIVAVTPMIVGTAEVPKWLKMIETEGVPAWGRATMAGRLGSSASPAQVEYWATRIQGRTPLTTLQSYLRWVPGIDIRADLPKIDRPLLVQTTTGGGLRPVDVVRAWQEQVRGSRLEVIEGDAWHAAGAYPDLCAQSALRFLRALPRTGSTA